MVDRNRRLLLPRPVRRQPADLLAAVALAIATDLVALMPVVRETPLRIVLGLPYVMFVPGYVLVAALFPETGGSSAGGERRSIDGVERVALSFGLSIAVVSLIGLALNYSPWGIRLVPVLVAVSGITFVGAASAGVRRMALPEAERFSAPLQEWATAGRTALFQPETRADFVLNVLLVASVLLALGSVGYAVAVQPPGEGFTEFYLLTGSSEGELAAADYPTEFELGESRSIVVGVDNNEHGPRSYTVVAVLQRVEVAGNDTRVLEERELDRFSRQVAAGETWRTEYAVTPTFAGERLRLVFLLYSEPVPAEPTVENAYREAHLWVNVTASG